MADKVTCKVQTLAGKDSGSIELDADVFQAPVHASLVHQVVRWQRAKRRAGTHATLNRAKMEGGGAKPWKQKGSGRARAGSSNSPLWKGGAVIHGPQPRSYEFRMPKRLRRQALASILSARLAEEKLLVVDNFDLSEAKTKEVAKALQALGIDSAKACCVCASTDEAFQRASKNLPGVTTLSVAGVNVYDLVKRPALICSKETVLELQARVKGELQAATEKAA